MMSSMIAAAIELCGWPGEGALEIFVYAGRDEPEQDSTPRCELVGGVIRGKTYCKHRISFALIEMHMARCMPVWLWWWLL